jgi:bifunctional non-homologous end joining protein LigD
MNPTTNPTSLPSASLHFKEGSSDKVYHAAVELKDDGYIVTFAYGRRGSTLSTGVKTDAPLPLETATKVFDKLIASKVAKGYNSDGEPAAVYQQSGSEGNDSGIRCQLLNPVDEDELTRLLGDKRHCMQEKFDGRRLLVRKRGDEVIGINRRGLVVAIPEKIRHAVEELPADVLIDGEAIGDTLHAFDLLESKDRDLRSLRYMQRFDKLLRLLDREHKHLRPVTTLVGPADKRAMFETFKQTGSEGVVFKDIDAAYTPGRTNSGGTQLKFKFVESASFIVTARNAKRSVTLGLFDGNELVGAGNVTIPPNHAVPAVGEVVEAKFLYAFRESGSIYQPVYLGKRCDIPASECTTGQLKYKTAADAAA